MSIVHDFESVRPGLMRQDHSNCWFSLPQALPIDNPKDSEIQKHTKLKARSSGMSMLTFNASQCLHVP